ncbi:unnamed protein product, partial [Polarella glacialis]
VMQRFGTGSETGLLSTCFQGWQQVYSEVLKDKELDGKIKESQEKLKEFLKDKKESAGQVLITACSSTESAIIHQAFSAWKGLAEDIKKKAELDQLLSAETLKVVAFSSQNKLAGKTVLERATCLGDEMLLTRVLCGWRIETRLDASLKMYHQKVEAKRQQLSGVHQMFRTFATQLDSGLKGQDSAREKDSSQRRLAKTEGTISLPNIRRPTSGGAQPGSRERSK